MSEITSRDAQFMIGHCQSELVGIGGTEKSSIYPSSFKTCAIAALTLEEGITTDTLLTICALRTRVNISEIGSLILIDIFPLSPALPTRFDYARNFSAECNLTDFAARQAKFPECPARTARKRAAVTLPGGIRVARQLLQFQTRVIARFLCLALVIYHLFKSGALCGIFLHQAGALLFTFNQGAFSHHFALNGTLKQLRSASASSTLFVSILILISMPRN